MVVWAGGAVVLAVRAHVDLRGIDEHVTGPPPDLLQASYAQNASLKEGFVSVAAAPEILSFL